MGWVAAWGVIFVCVGSVEADPASDAIKGCPANTSKHPQRPHNTAPPGSPKVTAAIRVNTKNILARLPLRPARHSQPAPALRRVRVAGIADPARLHFHKSRVIAYVVEAEGVLILRVLSGRQDWARYFSA